MSILPRLLEELERDEAGRRRLARMLAADIASEGELRVLLVNAVLREVATKEDLRRLEERMERLEKELREKIRRLDERIDSLVKWLIGLLASIWATLVALLLPVVLKLLSTP